MDKRELGTLREELDRVQKTIDELMSSGWRARFIARRLQRKLNSLEGHIAEERDRALRRYFRS